jgi:hypothetical protein
MGEEKRDQGEKSAIIRNDNDNSKIIHDPCWLYVSWHLDHWERLELGISLAGFGSG